MQTNQMIDLRSDTVTRPTPEMLQFMFQASVGDDVFGDDPSVKKLENDIAKMFGKEAALFCPSGTMTNQIALRILTQPQDEVICHKYAHIYLYEGGGMAYNSMLSPKLLEGDRGRLTAEEIEKHLAAEDIHAPRTRVVGLENTMNKGGGSIYSMQEMVKIKALCDQHGLSLHMDGARIFNALVENGDDPRTYGPLFDTISVCFSKGLGAPVGSALLASKELIHEAKRVRKVLGGGMRQAGYLAAACSYALDNQIDRLKDDHRRARIVGKAMSELPMVKEVMPVDTNIVIAEIDGMKPAQFIDELKSKGILAVRFGPQAVRFVTHLDFDDHDLDRLLTLLNDYK